MAMSVNVEVSLISGRSVSLEIELDAAIDTLRRRAQAALEVNSGLLLDTRPGFGV